MTRLSTFIGLVLGLLLASGGHASTVTTSNCFSTFNCAVTIDNLLIGSTTYHVSFFRAPYANFIANYPQPFFGSPTGAQAAVNAINAVLNANGLVLVQDGATPAVNNSNYLVPYDLTGVNFSAVQGFRSGPPTSFTWTSQDIPVSTFGVQTFAAITTVVPIPAAAWLFGGALGLLGVVRRRSA